LHQEYGGTVVTYVRLTNSLTHQLRISLLALQIGFTLKRNSILFFKIGLKIIYYEKLVTNVLNI